MSLRLDMLFIIRIFSENVTTGNQKTGGHMALNEKDTGKHI